MRTICSTVYGGRACWPSRKVVSVMEMSRVFSVLRIELDRLAVDVLDDRAVETDQRRQPVVERVFQQVRLGAIDQGIVVLVIAISRSVDKREIQWRATLVPAYGLVTTPACGRCAGVTRQPLAPGTPW